MARPKLGKEPYVHLGLRLDPQMLPALDAYVAAVQRQMGLWDVRIDRGKALRHLVVEGLKREGYLPHDDEPRIETGEEPSVASVAPGSGPALAPVTTGQDRGADRLPMDADQFEQKAAKTQDHQRTTGRTGRKRPAVAKG